jgi:hypothetical protein
MSEASKTHGNERNVHKILVGKPDEKIILGRTRHREENNTVTECLKAGTVVLDRRLIS